MGGEVVGPIGQGRPRAGQRLETAGEEILEIGASDIAIILAALDEIHRHVEGIVDIALEAHAVLEDERQHAGAIVIGRAPDRGALRQVAVQAPVGERRIGEQGGREGLQRDRHPKLLDHVGFAGEIVVRLDGTGPEHHVEAAGADLGHVARHDGIAALRHRRRFGRASISGSCRASGSRCRAHRRWGSARRNACPVPPGSRARSKAARRTIRTGRPARAIWRPRPSRPPAR